MVMLPALGNFGYHFEIVSVLFSCPLSTNIRMAVAANGLVMLAMRKG